jgi:photoactive yellow protein
MTDLSRLTEADIDSLPFGFIGLTPDGTIRKYNRYEADLARTDPQQALGRNFFREVAPCTQVKEFEGRFREFAAGAGEPTLCFDFVFTFRYGAQKVRIGLVRSPMSEEVIVTINRVRDLSLAHSAHIEHDTARRLLLDAAGRPVVALGDDFWRALSDAVGSPSNSAHDDTLHRVGVEWGLRHALRVEALVQREQHLALREVELYVALEYLSGSLGVMGLGHLEVDLQYRRRGLLITSQRDGPTARASGGEGLRSCALMAGLHAGLLSHLSGRRLAGRELNCARGPQEPCRFVVATESRLARLFDPVEGSSDANVLVALSVRPELVAQP